MMTLFLILKRLVLLNLEYFESIYSTEYLVVDRLLVLEPRLFFSDESLKSLFL